MRRPWPPSTDVSTRAGPKARSPICRPCCKARSTDGRPARTTSGFLRVSEGTRTPDRRDHNPELYQLSYAHQEAIQSRELEHQTGHERHTDDDVDRDAERRVPAPHVGRTVVVVVDPVPCPVGDEP